MNLYKNYFLNQEKIKEIIKRIQLNNEVEISEADRNIVSLISLCLSEEEKSDIVIVAPNTFHAQKLYDLISKQKENVFFYPKDDFISTELLTESLDFKLQRINTLKNVFYNKNPKIIITNLAAILSKAPKKEVYGENIIKLTKDKNIKPKDLTDKMVAMGYERNYTVEKQGDFSLKGSVFDLFPVNEDKAYRIDFFGNTIETIKIIDTETQRSKDSVDSLLVMPKSETLFTDEEKDTIRFYINDKLSTNLSDKTREKFENDLVYLDETSDYTLLQKYISIFEKDNYSFVDYIDNKIMMFYDYDFIKKQEANIQNQLYDYLSNFDNYFTTGSFLNELSYYYFEKSVYFTPKKQFSRLEELNLSSVDVNNYESRLDLFKADLTNSFKEKTVLLTISNKNYEIVKDLLESSNISYTEPKTKIKEKSINLLYDVYLPAMDIKAIDAIIINDEKLFKSFVTAKGNKYKLNVETKRLKSISELKIGDYVVHYDYGIGKFQEITTMTLRNHTSDFIHIKYDGNQSVYIPVENLHVLSKYAGSESYTPKLSSLNSKEWEKTKNSARSKASELATRLLALYSEREKVQGFKYIDDDETMNEFESEFGYELTLDQIKAIKDVKSDMESDKLMDRLVCGDVGFGKTEVAIRAAFKAVLSGKQVAYLAPTTILARQHYHTFKERMEKYGVNVALVSRFVQPQVIRENLKNLSRGVVDIIIGTHRLLSNDVGFKNLGLVIIDEEQRFGVEAKEKLKEFKTNVDVLTLTATPIPRTLQMAITGLKNVSLIETAPKGRYPIQTYVLERNDYVVKDAIEREIGKGGQVFYLYNRVEDMDRIIRYVSSLVPDARIGTIHGKMERNKIEDTIEAFINKEFDILISTTIIETGIDIPNVNTLIVHDADRYGLSQLYQIKGRVGRSDKISYAYLMYEKNKTITEDAQKRLQAIKDFAELGSGFKIAVRDLTTRGAGEVLGKEQSGFMDKVGIDLYLKMLDEEIKKQKGEDTKKPEDEIRVIMSRHIDKDYISDDYALIEIHTKISKIKSSSNLEQLLLELEDRFGKVKDNLLEYMYSKLTENLVNSMTFERKEFTENSFLICFSVEKSKTIDAQALFKCAIETSQLFSFYFRFNKIFVTYDLKQGHTKIEMFKNISKFLETLKTKNII